MFTFSLCFGIAKQNNGEKERDCPLFMDFFSMFHWLSLVTEVTSIFCLFFFHIFQARNYFYLNSKTERKVADYLLRPVSLVSEEFETLESLDEFLNTAQ